MKRKTLTVLLATFAFVLALSIWTHERLGASRAVDGALADIAILGVSPRDVSLSDADAFDTVSPGIGTVGINKTVYMAPRLLGNVADQISAFTWAVDTQPSAGAATILEQSDTLFKFIPTKAGEYIISLTPLDLASAATPTSTMRIWVAAYQGVNGGVLKCSVCHPGYVTSWETTAHAQKLQKHLNGIYTEAYDVSCLACHTVGSFADTRGDGSFLDKAAGTGYDLNQIVALVDDAIANGNQNYSQLPADLQKLSSIQCESCHGPGSTHMGNVTKITGTRFDGAACMSCHDGVGRYKKGWQWLNSGHNAAAIAAGGYAASNDECAVCHTAEGFVELNVRGNGSIPADMTERNALTCVACHDPHADTLPGQLRKKDAVTLAAGVEYDKGTGNLCAGCHNSQVADPAKTIDPATGNFRGAHHGPQADILLGVSAFDWGSPFSTGAGIHQTAVDEGCVGCHMGQAPEGADSWVGGHSFRLNDPDTGASTAESACGGCHPGLTTTDRITFSAADYDGNGAVEGVQTETRGIIENLKIKILELIPDTTFDEHEGRITIVEETWLGLSEDERGVLYNFNLIAEDKSDGVHNLGFSIAVLQRSWLYLTGEAYNESFPDAVLIEGGQGGGGLSAPGGVSASDGAYTDRVAIIWDAVDGATHYRVSRSTSPGSERIDLGAWQEGLAFADLLSTDTVPAEGVTYYYWVRAAKGENGEEASGFSNIDSGWIMPDSTSDLNRVYRIAFHKCDVALNTSGSLTITNTRGKSSVKISEKKNGFPSNVHITDGISTSGSVYYMRRALVPLIRIERTTGSLTLHKLYTEAPVKALDSAVEIASLTAKNTAIEEVSARGLRRVKMTARPNSSGEGVSLFSALESTGAPQKRMKVSLSGVGLRTFLARGQNVASIKVASKKGRTTAGTRFVAYADIVGGNVEARELRTISVTGGMLSPREIWSLSGTKTMKIFARAGIFSLPTLLIRSGDICPGVVDVTAPSLRMKAVGGDLKPNVVLAWGEIRELTAKYKTVRGGAVSADFIGGELGLTSEDLATTSVLSALVNDRDFYLTTTTIASSATSSSLFVSGLGGDAAASNIISVFGARGIQASFMAGAQSIFGTTWIDLAIEPTLSGFLRKIRVGKTGPFGTPRIKGEAWSNPQKETIFKGDKTHTGFILYEETP